MAAFFMSGTGTAVGKTYVACSALRHLRARSRSPFVLKPVHSGYDRPEDSDGAQLLAAAGLPNDAAQIAAISPWRFAAPLSPDRAAALAGAAIDVDAVARWCRQASGEDGLIEGAGGLMTPLSPGRTYLDLMIALQLPVILVTAPYLGALSHVLTALEVLRQHRLHLAALIVNAGAPDATVSREDFSFSLHQSHHWLRAQQPQDLEALWRELWG